MSQVGGGSPWGEFPPSLRCEPIKVQGVTVNPGDDILVLGPYGERERLPYKGFVERDGQRGVWCDIGFYTWGPQPGPYRFEDVRHPSLLDGIAKELGAE